VTPREKAVAALADAQASAYEEIDAEKCISAIESAGLRICGTCGGCNHWRAPRGGLPVECRMGRAELRRLAERV